MSINYLLPNIEPIKIIINTNIPGKESVTLTSSMIYHPSIKEMPKLSEYPLIAMDRSYVSVSRYLNRQTYEKKLKFFFDRESHIKGLSIVGLYTPNKQPKKVIENPEEIAKKKSENKKNKEIEDEINQLIQKINQRKNDTIRDEIKNAKKKNKDITKDKLDALKEDIKKNYKDQIEKVKIGEIKGDSLKYELNGIKYDSVYKKHNPTDLNTHIKMQKEKSNGMNPTAPTIENVYEYANKNIMILLETLFPNCFPVINNIGESFETMILQKPLPFTFKNTIPSFLRPSSYPNQLYSYLKIGGTTYTSTRLIWVNDIYNHPIYSGLVNKYKLFDKAKETARKKLEIELNKKRTKFKSEFSENGDYAINQTLIDFFINQKKKEPSASTIIGESENSRINETISKIIEDIENLIQYLDFDPPKYNLILDVTNSIRQRYRNIEDKIVKTKDIDTKLTRLVKSISNINIYEVIFSKYLDSSEIIIDYESEEDSVKNILKSNYQFYVTFVDSLKGFIRPNKESTNLELQNILEDFATGVVDSQQKFDLLMNPRELIESPENKNIANTGVSILPPSDKDPRFEIYVEIDFIEGEVNHENRLKYNCIYKSEYLGIMLDRLLYPHITKWELDKKRIFFNINDKQVQKEIKDKEAKIVPPPPSDSKSSLPPPPPPPPPQGEEKAKQGGTRLTYRQLPIFKLRSSNRRTKKKYSYMTF